MKLAKITYLLSILLILSSCEEIGIIEEDLPYVNLYEVDGQISPGIKDPIINFTKSIPINEKYDINKTALTDVNTYIWSEEQGIFNLKHIGNGAYKPTNLYIRANAIYELFADIEGTRVYAITKVPAKPQILSAEIDQGRIVCKVAAKQGEVYSCIYVVLQGVSVGNPKIKLREKDFFSVEGNVSESVVEIRTGEIPEEYLTASFDTRIAVEVYAWDKSYKAYFETKDNNKPIDDIFSQGGGLINWNVYGENTIGLFMGYSTILYDNIKN